MKDIDENYWAYGPIVEAMNGHDYERIADGKNERWIRLNGKNLLSQFQQQAKIID